MSTSISDESEGYVVPLGLGLTPAEQYKIYQMRVEATEAGGCKKMHDIDVLVKRVGSNLSSGSASTTDYALGRYDASTHKFYNNKFDEFMGYSSGHAYAVPGAECVSSNEDGEAGHPTGAKAVRIYSYYTMGWEVSPVGSGTITATSEDSRTLTSNSSEVCPGDQIHLNVTPTGNYRFVMWDDDPSQPQNLDYVVTTDGDHLTAYLAPNSYWWEAVTSDPGAGHYEVSYHGHVDIYDNTGLAWLISTTNGLNGQQARSFAFDTIEIHAGTYDMSAHLWTPLGTTRTPFRGCVMMDAGATITNLSVNEDYSSYLGMFGYADSARIDGVKLQNSVIRGLSYAGGVAGYAGPNSVIKNCVIDNTNTITSNNCAGGIVGSALDVTVNGCTSQPTLVGNIIRAGGLIGQLVGGTDGPGCAIKNNTIEVNGRKLSSLYLGGMAGSASGTIDTTDDQNAKSGSSSHISIANNYVRINSSSRSFYVGGLVGNAEAVDLENNYAYGSIDGFSANGGLVGWVGDQVSAENCYYAQADAESMSGTGRAMSQHNTSTFTGEGNHVTLADTVDGTANLTIALNQWVRDANGAKSADGTEYKTWRSDLEHEHDGFPVFGSPDNIPVYDTVSDVACDSLTWYDSTYTVSGTYSHTESDSANFVDNVTVMNLTIHYSQSVELSDSVQMGSDYFGEHFSFTAEEIRNLLGDDTLADVHTLQIVDSLLTENGCDSVVTFNLVVYGTTGLTQADRFAISVYPNPTAGRVEVKADALQRVEIYDAVSRKVMDQQGIDGKCLFDLSALPSGSYYLRIYSAKGTAVKKVVKR